MNSHCCALQKYVNKESERECFWSDNVFFFYILSSEFFFCISQSSWIEDDEGRVILSESDSIRQIWSWVLLSQLSSTVFLKITCNRFMQSRSRFRQIMCNIRDSCNTRQRQYTLLFLNCIISFIGITSTTDIYTRKKHWRPVRNPQKKISFKMRETNALRTNCAVD